MKYYTLFLECILFFALVFAEQGKITYTSEVVSLNKDTFKNTIADAPNVIVKYFSPNCGHCKALAPTYGDVAKEVRERNMRVVVAEVDCSVNEEICNEQKIYKYPTLKFYKEGEYKKEFEGKRTVEDIMEFINDNARAQIYIVHGKEILEFINKYKTDEQKLLIGYFNRIGDTDYKVFEKVAKKLGDEFIYAAAGDELAAEVVGGVVIPGIVMYKDYDEAIPRNSKLTEETIEQFVKIHRIPNLDILTEENYPTYLDTKIPLYIFYYEKDIQYEKYKSDLYDISKLYRGRLYFVATKTILKETNKTNKTPTIGIYNPHQPEFFYPFMKGKRMNQANLVAFGEAYFRHEIVPQILEEPIKARVYENNVVVLNQKNYDEIVLDEDRDVAVLYYSPHCEYSKKVMPIWDFLGGKYLYQRQNITIAKFDAYNMKIPKSSPWKDLEYYPTIVVYQAIDKVKIDEEAKKQNVTVESYSKGIVVYGQDRSRGVQEIVNFIRKVTTNENQLYLNIMEISQFEVDDEISSDEESSEEEDLDGDTALERARKRKEAEKKRKEKRLQKEAEKKKAAASKKIPDASSKKIPEDAEKKNEQKKQETKKLMAAKSAENKKEKKEENKKEDKKEDKKEAKKDEL